MLEFKNNKKELNSEELRELKEFMCKALEKHKTNFKNEMIAKMTLMFTDTIKECKGIVNPKNREVIEEYVEKLKNDFLACN